MRTQYESQLDRDNETQVARELGRKGIGIELNPEYIEMALKRINVSQELLKI